MVNFGPIFRQGSGINWGKILPNFGPDFGQNLEVKNSGEIFLVFFG